MTDSELIKILGGISFQAVEEIKGLIDERNSLRQQLADSAAENERLREALEVIQGIMYSIIGCDVHNRVAREALKEPK